MRLEISRYDGPHAFAPARQVKATLSRRNLLAMLHKLDMPGSARRIENNDVYIYDRLVDDVVFVLCCEDDDEHYSHELRSLKGEYGLMVGDTEAFIARGDQYVENPDEYTDDEALG